MLPAKKNNLEGIAIEEYIKNLEVSDDEIKENFRLLTGRPITQRSVSVGKCIAKIAQWHVVEILKLGLMPLRAGNYYMVKAEVLDELFRKLDRNSIEHATKDKD